MNDQPTDVLDGAVDDDWFAALGATETPGSPVPGTRREPGTGTTDAAVPGSLHRGAEPGTAPEEALTPLYVDVAALLDDGLPEPPAPLFLRRTDGHALFYAGQVSLLFGEPETGKGWVALAACSEALVDGFRVMVIDLDHNGPEATVSRLIDLGAPLDALRDQRHFRYVEPDDLEHLGKVVRDALAWRPAVVMLDSLGELLPLAGANSNSPDDFTRVHSRFIKPMAPAGAAVIAVVHVPKNPESSAMGATGTAAKRRAIGGASLRVRLTEAFTPGVGGACTISIHKDRHGGVRRYSPTGDREPLAGTFRLSVREGDRLTWRLHAPEEGERNPAETAASADIEAVAALAPEDRRTVEAARQKLGWRKDRTGKAMKAFRERGGEDGSRFPPPVSGTGNREDQPTLEVVR